MSGVFLDTDFTFRAPVPDDINQTGIIGSTTQFYNPYRAINRRTNIDLTNNELLALNLKNSDILVNLLTISNAFFPRSVTVGTSPTEIIAPAQAPRGYIIINPNTTVSGVVTSVTMFPAGTVFPVGTTNSSPVTVSGHGGAAFTLVITEASAGPVSVDLQTQDPVTGTWITAQSDIFSGAKAVGGYYANVGAIGIDVTARLAVVVAGDSFTGSIGAMLKPQLSGTIAGPTVFLGNNDVNTTIGYPLLSGQKETWQLLQNTPLFGVAVASTQIRVFELQ